jgi:hypothetical protein
MRGYRLGFRVGKAKSLLRWAGICRVAKGEAGIGKRPIFSELPKVSIFPGRYLIQ